MPDVPRGGVDAVSRSPWLSAIKCARLIPWADVLRARRQLRPASPSMFAGLALRRLLIRWKRRDDLHLGFPQLACCLIASRFVTLNK